jgi:threonine dehydrogenase-like Zn-dependent dehydrogenase
MDQTMKILQIVAPGQTEWREAPVPQPGEGQVLVKVEGVTTCPHWDLHLMSGIPMFPWRPQTYPYTPGQPGHEAVGEVVALGPGVSDPVVGTRVSCWRDQGHDRQGCYGEYVVMEAPHVIAVPRDLATEAIAPLELAMCVQVSFDRLAWLDAVPGKRFGVSGLGPAGLVAVQMAKAYGASEVVGIDPLPERRALASQLGADIVMPPEDEAFPAGRTGPSALHASIDCTGLKPAIEFLMERTFHVVTVFGVMREPVEFQPHHWGRLTLMGYGTHYREAAERALKLVTAGSLDLTPLVTHTLPMTRYAEGVELLKNKEAIKVCFLP